MILTIVFIIIISITVGIYIWVLYNKLAVLRNDLETSKSQFTTELLRRHDLIPSLVETVRGYASHESETLRVVIQARSNATSSPGNDISSENMLTSALGKLIALNENYPNLKADQSFISLQQELSDIENRLNMSRRIFNENVNIYNKTQQTFPSVLIASRLGHERAELFQAPEASASRPDFRF